MIWALYQSSDGCFQQYNMPTHTVVRKEYGQQQQVAVVFYMNLFW